MTDERMSLPLFMGQAVKVKIVKSVFHTQMSLSIPTNINDFEKNSSSEIIDLRFSAWKS
jgi:hypothetical protein